MRIEAKLGSFLAMLGICVFLSGCQKITTTYPDYPVITFKSYSVQKNADSTYSLALIISFTDGNGNVGLSQVDTSGPFSPKSKYYYNLWVGYYEFYKDSFIHVGQSFPFTSDTINYNGRIPVLTPAGKYKAILGDIEYDINLGKGTKSGANTIRFDFILIDRALQQSNPIKSPPIVLTP